MVGKCHGPAPQFRDENPKASKSSTLSCQPQQHLPSRAPRPHVAVKWMHIGGVAGVTVLELVSDTQ